MIAQGVTRGWVVWWVVAWCGLSAPLSGCIAACLSWSAFGATRADRALPWATRPGWWVFTNRVIVEPLAVWVVCYLAVALEGALRAVW